jgi:hypothetical protein
LGEPFLAELFLVVPFLAEVFVDDPFFELDEPFLAGPFEEDRARFSAMRFPAFRLI